MMPKDLDGLPVRIHRSPEEQAAINQWHRSIGAALAGNLNASVTQAEPQKPVALPATKPARGEFFDYEGIPCSLGMAGVRYSLAWDTDPPRVFDPVSMRRNGAPITWPAFKAMVEQLRRDAAFRRFLKAATEGTP